MVLLPDGRVFVGGGDGRLTVDPARTPSPHDYDIYEPAYLHSSSPRPTAVALPVTGQDPDGTYLLSRGQLQVSLTCSLYSGSAFEGLDYVDKLVLMAPGSITHHSDMSARYIELASVAVSSTERRFDVPAETVAPGGYYMLFAVTNAGIPAEAIWVRISP
jgi:hypothetical protein